MRTVVFQSYRKTGVPAWLEACMGSVRAWAASKGIDYRFIGDELFDQVPAWFRDKADGHICPVTDLARLVVAKKLLASGYDRAIWIDADMLVFAPTLLAVDSRGYALSYELWFSAPAQRELKFTNRVNNSLSMFTAGTPYLDFFIDAYLQIAQAKAKLGKLDLGSSFLTRLGTVMPLNLIRNVGMFSPALMADIASRRDQHLSAYAQLLPQPLACANLCGSFIDQAASGSAEEKVYEAVVERCLSSGGDVVNRFRAAPPGQRLIEVPPLPPAASP